MIRAKFRCLELTQKYDGSVIARFGPVKRSGGKDPENEEFWKYTPSGEMVLYFVKGCDISPGAYYYVDLQQTEKSVGTWELTRREENEHYLNVDFSWSRPREEASHPGMIGGVFKMGLSDLAEEAKSRFGVRGSHWMLMLTLAEHNDGNPNLYG